MKLVQTPLLGLHSLTIDLTGSGKPLGYLPAPKPQKDKNVMGLGGLQAQGARGPLFFLFALNAMVNNNTGFTGSSSLHAKAQATVQNTCQHPGDAAAVKRNV